MAWQAKSLLLSIVIIWCLGQLTCNSLLVFEYDPLLNKYVYEFDRDFRHRSEGWGKTLIGKHGINAICDIRSITGKKIAILRGDVDFDAAKEIAGSITPVPGGVGPMTITMLMKNTLNSMKFKIGID